MCWGYSQSSLVGAKTATLLLPAHLESRLSGSAERLTPSLLPSPHPSIHPSASAAVSPPPSSTVCVAAGAQLKFKLQHSLFPLSHSLFSALVSFFLFSLLLARPPTHPMKDRIVEIEKTCTHHGAHVEDIIEGIVIPLPLKTGA